MSVSRGGTKSTKTPVASILSRLAAASLLTSDWSRSVLSILSISIIFIRQIRSIPQILFNGNRSFADFPFLVLVLKENGEFVKFQLALIPTIRIFLRFKRYLLCPVEKLCFLNVRIHTYMNFMSRHSSNVKLKCIG